MHILYIKTNKNTCEVNSCIYSQVQWSVLRQSVVCNGDVSTVNSLSNKINYTYIKKYFNNFNFIAA